MKTVGLLIGGKTARRTVQEKPAKQPKTRKAAKPETAATDDGDGD